MAADVVDHSLVEHVTAWYRHYFECLDVGANAEPPEDGTNRYLAARYAWYNGPGAKEYLMGVVFGWGDRETRNDQGRLRILCW